MADEFDACECFWSHELAMRRLMSLLRQGQSYCNDNECTDLPSLPNVTGGANFFLIVMALIFMAVMYVLRPSSMRRSNDLNKSLPPPSNDGPNNDGGAPPSIS
uniref:Small integral membrane protein 14 n=1 Tax=Anopheles melas TaxID=34690 RepID=A0A182TTN0_9DIPT